MLYTDLTYEQMLVFVQDGHAARRRHWKDEFIFQRPADTLPVTVLLGVKSLPEIVKDYYELKHMPLATNNNPQVSLSAYLCLKNAEGNIHNGWYPALDDLAGKDWIILQLADLKEKA